MIEHVTLPITHYETSKAFYTAALEPLGYKIQYDFEGDAVGFTEGGHTSFWIVEKPKVEATHIAFLAKKRDNVHAFYNTSLKAGGKDNGPPGLRSEYSPDYYAAFVLDPDGHNIEAVCYN